MSQQQTHLEMNGYQILDALFHLLNNSNVSTTLTANGGFGFNSDTGKITVKNADGIQEVLYESQTTANTTKGQEGDKYLNKAGFETMLAAEMEAAALGLFENAGLADATGSAPVPAGTDKTKFYIVSGDGDFQGALSEAASDGDILLTHDNAGAITYKLIRTTITADMFVTLDGSIDANETVKGATQKAISDFVTSAVGVVNTALTDYQTVADAARQALADRATALETTTGQHTTQIGALQTTTTNQGNAITQAESDISGLQTTTTNQGDAITQAESDIAAIQDALLGRNTFAADSFVEGVYVKTGGKKWTFTKDVGVNNIGNVLCVQKADGTPIGVVPVGNGTQNPGFEVHTDTDPSALGWKLGVLVGKSA